MPSAHHSQRSQRSVPRRLSHCHINSVLSRGTCYYPRCGCVAVCVWGRVLERATWPRRGGCRGVTARVELDPFTALRTCLDFLRSCNTLKASSAGLYAAQRRSISPLRSLQCCSELPSKVAHRRAHNRCVHNSHKLLISRCSVEYVLVSNGGCTHEMPRRTGPCVHGGTEGLKSKLSAAMSFRAHTEPAQ